jgi:hypothetical protein
MQAVEIIVKVYLGKMLSIDQKSQFQERQTVNVLIVERAYECFLLENGRREHRQRIG